MQEIFQEYVTLTLVPTVPRNLTDIQFQGYAKTTVKWTEGSCGSGRGSSNQALVRLTVHLGNHHTYSLLVGGPGDVTINGSISNGCPQPPDNVFHTQGFSLVAPLHAPSQGVCGKQEFSDGTSFSWRFTPTTDVPWRISVDCFDVPPPADTGQ